MPIASGNARAAASISATLAAHMDFDPIVATLACEYRVHLQHAAGKVGGLEHAAQILPVDPVADHDHLLDRVYVSFLLSVVHLSATNESLDALADETGHGQEGRADHHRADDNGDKAIEDFYVEQLGAVGFTGEDGLEEIKMLRLSDGFSIRYLAVKDVFDIFPINRLSVSVQLPDIFEAVIECDGSPVELLNSYRLFENDAGSIRNPALCFVEADDMGGWERTILAPLLTASGYRVSFDDNDRGQADVILTRSLELPTVPEKTIRLLDSATNDTVVEGIYKYDRNNLVAAIETKLRRAVS